MDNGKKLLWEFRSNGLKCKVYDVVNKKLLGEFDSMEAAAEYIGCHPASIRQSIMNKGKIKATTNKLNIIITVR